MHVNKKRILIDYLTLKVQEEDWRSVIATAGDLLSLPATLKLPEVASKDRQVHDKDVPLQAIPPVDMPIPHNTNEVISVLRMSDEELVEKLFPLPEEQKVAGE